MITKKLCEYIINKGNLLKIPVIIDPKNENFNIYKNATLITPNQLEASKISQMYVDSDKKQKNVVK